MWGLERAALYPIAGAWTTGAILMTSLHSLLRLPWSVAIPIALLPAVLITAGALFLIQGKPAGYLVNWLEQFALGRCHFVPRSRRPRHPLNDSLH
jgi:hypothetical protein